jgi:hypothetical protein
MPSTFLQQRKIPETSPVQQPPMITRNQQLMKTRHHQQKHRKQIATRRKPRRRRKPKERGFSIKEAPTDQTLVTVSPPEEIATPMTTATVISSMMRMASTSPTTLPHPTQQSTRLEANSLASCSQVTPIRYLEHYTRRYRTKKKIL